MKLNKFLNLVSSTVKIDLNVDDVNKGIYANVESLQEESMYQNYTVEKVDVKEICDKIVLVLEVKSN